MGGLLIAIALVSFIDIGFSLYSEGVIRMSSITTLFLSVIAFFM
tara:strand:- start:3930 stop:4061 length:132 start_codon:yes stop_codon:yes gene_type:complete